VEYVTINFNINGLAMRIQGINHLEEENTWIKRTSEYIMEYFNSGEADDEGLFDAVVDMWGVEQTPRTRCTLL